VAEITFNRVVLITAETRDASPEEVEPTIDRSKVEAAIAMAFGGAGEMVLYPEPVGRAAVFCAEFNRLQPLEEDNREVAINCMLELLRGAEWMGFNASRDEISAKLDELEAGTLVVPDFVLWVRTEVRP
jgi:hypothetical protein